MQAMSPDLQIRHVFTFIVWSERLHMLHIIPAFLTVMQTSQNLKAKSCRVIFSLAS